MSWQREEIVGSNDSGECVTSMKIVFSAGSSRDLSSILAVCWFIFSGR